VGYGVEVGVGRCAGVGVEGDGAWMNLQLRRENFQARCNFRLKIMLIDSTVLDFCSSNKRW
jgi:hypothetical protein